MQPYAGRSERFEKLKLIADGQAIINTSTSTVTMNHVSRTKQQHPPRPKTETLELSLGLNPARMHNLHQPMHNDGYYAISQLLS
jgi:hypothetical protein